ncbi:hypothetical protein B0T19DRAFT_485992 [Cercophora scortea]|uniref:Uncharacterized protein n=1 Tax=Cercophora scortea TaxID=314031 RepID=A0AAE0IEW9_9PEZI|nr:hypothetical protein B0T19DRAFT_485992 [Cercophora scortea]
MSNYTATAAPPVETGSSPVSQGSAPYLPRTATLGGLPTIPLDVPVCAVFLALFIAGAATNMTIFQLNRRQGYKFLFSGLLFGFCMARIVALTMRIAWATHPTDINVAISSQIFTAAGVILLFVTNLVFTQRIVRAYHPFFGWHVAVGVFFKVLFVSIVAVLITVITVTVQSFFTLDPGTRGADRDVQLFCGTYFAAMAFLPIPLILLAIAIPRRTRIDKFGEGHFRTKFALLFFTATLLSAGAIFRCVTSYMTRPVTDPAWFQSKACYYCFNFGIEVIVVYTYALSRFDRRFHVPDGSSAPGHYSSSEYGASRSAISVAGAGLGAAAGGAGAGAGAGVTEGLMGGGSIADFEKRVSLFTNGKRTSGWSDKSIGKRPKSGGSGKSVKSAYADSPSDSDSATREADMEWMARAMRELYGESEDES